MSIWVSRPGIGFDELEDAPAGQVRSYANGWSNHYPTTDGTVEREASVDTAHVPAWCVPGHEDNFDGETVGGWLRLTVRTTEHDFWSPRRVVGDQVASVVIDEDAARALVADLRDWLDTPKAREFPELPQAPELDTQEAK